MSDFINKLREQKIKINENVELAVFDISASYIGIYLISKYIFELKKPGITSAIALIPISYLSHQFFEVETPLNNLINGKGKKDDLQQPSVPIDNNLQQNYQQLPSQKQQPDLKNNILQSTPYEPLERPDNNKILAYLNHTFMGGNIGG